MNKTILIAKSNIMRHISATVSLFVISAAVSALFAIGLSIVTGANRDLLGSFDRLNGFHSSFVISKDKYDASYEALIRENPLVEDADIGEVLYPTMVTVNYGGVIDLDALIFNLDAPMRIAGPIITESDPSVAPETAVYLPAYAKSAGYKCGDEYALVYRNMPIALTVAGFIETNDFSVPNHGIIKYFVPGECYASLKRVVGSSVWITVRFYDCTDSARFNNEFIAAIDLEMSYMGGANFASSYDDIAESALIPTMSIASLLIAFAFLIALVSLMVIRFRVTNGIEGSMREIGTLKAAGYLNAQIASAYATEYGAVVFVAALAGVAAAAPAFPFIKRVLTGMTGFGWTLGLNPAACAAAVFFTSATILAMALFSCGRIKKITPVTALRGGVAEINFRREHFSLLSGPGGVDLRLGLKNIFSFSKMYVLVGLLLAATSLAVVFVGLMFHAFSIDRSTLYRMVNIEFADAAIDVAGRADASALAPEIEALPGVRKTTMLDWTSFIVEGTTCMGLLTDDFSAMENMRAYDGRYPRFDNEVALPKLLADRIGKKIGDAVKVKANGVTLEYIVTGFFSTASFGGKIATMSLSGFQRLDPNYRRKTIMAYLEDGVGFDEFSEMLKNSVGILHVYGDTAYAGASGDGGSAADAPGEKKLMAAAKNEERFAVSKARANELISNYLFQYGVDSVEYAVIYNGEIILSGSSDEYRIKSIKDQQKLIDAQVGVYAIAVAFVMEVVAAVSLIIIALILMIMVRSIVAKRRHDFGCLMSCGFTSKQLAWQLAVSFIPVSLAGAVMGCTAGALLLNPVMNAIFQGAGVYNAKFDVNPAMVIIAGIFVILSANITAYVSALQIRRISAYNLLTE